MNRTAPEKVIVRAGPRGTAVLLQDTPVEHWLLDPRGRLVYAFREDRGGVWFHLNGQVVLRHHRSGSLHFVSLSPEESLPLYDQAVRRLQEVAEGVEVAGEAVLREDRRRFQALYGRLPILPPDQYLAVVLQLTRGCPWNRCRFCTFYRDTRYRVRTGRAWEEHVRSVRAWMEPVLTLRDRFFLADASALALPEDTLFRALETVRRVFPEMVERRAVFSFVDLPSSLRRGPRFFSELGRFGLRRVYLGVESGDDALLTALNKPQTSRDVEGVVRAFKEHGVAVGLIFLVGVGGEPVRERHRDASLELLHRLPLDREDQVYLSPYVPVGDLPGLPPGDVEGELARWREELSGLPCPVARYDIRLWPGGEDPPGARTSAP